MRVRAGGCDITTIPACASTRPCLLLTWRKAFSNSRPNPISNALRSAWYSLPRPTKFPSICERSSPRSSSRDAPVSTKVMATPAIRSKVERAPKREVA